MKIKVVVYVSILSSILLATGLVVATSYSSNGVEQAYSLLPGIPSNESPFSEFINSTTEDDALDHANYDVLSTNPYIIRVDNRYRSKINEFQARGIAFEFLEAIFTPDVFDTISNGSIDFWGLRPHWSLQFSVNSTQDPNTQVGVFVDVNSISGEIEFYMGPLPIQIMLNLTTDFNAVEAAKTVFRIFNTSIPSNSRYEQFSYDNSQFSFVFSQTVGPVVIQGSIGGISLDFFNSTLENSSSGRSCRYAKSWIPFSEIPIEHIRSPYSSEPVLRGLMLMHISNDFNFWSLVHDYRLCWWFSNSNSSEIIELKMDAFSGEIVYYHNYYDIVSRIIFPYNTKMIVIPISSMVFASIFYLMARRKILKS